MGVQKTVQKKLAMTSKAGQALSSFEGVMDQLLGPGGCPWDRAQTHHSLKRYLIEEAYEVYEAIEEEDDDKLCEELGDVLLQVVFHSALAKKAGNFSLEDVVCGLEKKMVSRHPHVFSDLNLEDAGAVEVHWEALKKKEKAGRSKGGLLEVPKAMDPLYRAEKLQGRAQKAGLKENSLVEDLDRQKALAQELDQALTGKKNEEAKKLLGQSLFLLVDLSRKLGADPADLLQRANDQFLQASQRKLLAED